VFALRAVEVFRVLDCGQVPTAAASEDGA
jgi:hypothetical protein